MDFNGKKIAIAVTGSIAAYRTADLVRELYRRGAQTVTCLMTEAAQRFISPLTLEALSKQPVLTDVLGTNEIGVPDHIWLAQQYDALLIHPATTNCLAKLANGLADDIVTTTAITFTDKPVLIAPAMNTRMWEHPLTTHNLATLNNLDNVTIVSPHSGELACGEVGEGHLAEQGIVLQQLYKQTHPNRQLLKGKTVLVTAGGTAEPIDPVRQITNRSSGKMGTTIADEAFAMGASVILLASSSIQSLSTKPYVLHRFQTVDELDVQLSEQFTSSDYLYMAAAVSDFKPITLPTKKIKRSGELTLDLVPTKDLLRGLQAQKQSHQTIVGFAAESNNIMENADAKLKRKGLDAIVVNDISRTDIGFEVDENQVTVMTADGQSHQLAKASKYKIARQVLALTAGLVSVKATV